MSTRMQQRRGTAAQWISTNSGNGPILAAGEIGFESDTNKFKIGDGINHWLDLVYFTDIESILGGISGVDLPAALDTLNELANALGDDSNFATTMATSLGNKQDKVSGVSDTEIGYLDGVTSSIQTQLNAKAASADITELAQDAVNTAIVAGTGLDKTYNDNGNTITLDIDSTVATKSFAANLLTNATKSNITITGDENGLTISAENGVADSTTDNLTEGSTNKYFTDERAQDAVGNAVGTGLTYTDSTGAIAVDTTAIQARVANVSDTEIGYLDGVSSAIQTQLNSKAPTADPTFTGTVSGVTKSHVGLGNVDNTSDADKPVSTATQTALDLKAPKADPTFTGTATTNNLVVDGDFTVNGTNFSASATSITIEDNLVQIAHQNPANTVDLGLVVGYNDGTAKHAGIVKDTSANTWKLFKGVTTEPSTTVDFTQGSLDDLELNALTASSITVGNVSNTEFGYLNGVTSAIQTQLDNKQANVAGVSDTEIGYLDGVTSSIQTQLDAKVSTSSLGTGVATFLGTPTSANLASAVTGETGSGALVFGSSPTLKGPVYFQSGGGAGGTANFIDVNNSTGAVSLTSGYPLNLTASGDVTITATGGAAKVGSDTIATLTASQTLSSKTLSGATLTGTLTAGASAGTSGQVLSSTGTGVQWITVSGYSAPTLGSTSIASGATVTTIAGLTLTAPTLTGTVTASGDINLSAVNGPGSIIDEFNLLLMSAL
jgi:hypothetical protein